MISAPLETEIDLCLLTVTHAVRAKVQKKKGVLENGHVCFRSEILHFCAFVKDPASSDDITGMKLVASIQRLMGEGGLLI